LTSKPSIAASQRQMEVRTEVVQQGQFMERERSIFALDVAGRAAFAFEAKSLAQAEELTRAPWFARALGKFHANKPQGWDSNIPVRARVATEAEISVYQELADEFADLSARFFIAHLSDLTSAH
jgi:hypothetical protein